MPQQRGRAAAPGRLPTAGRGLEPGDTAGVGRVGFDRSRGWVRRGFKAGKSCEDEVKHSNG